MTLSATGHRKGGFQTRSKLLDTALNLIWKQSYGSVSVDDICREAGVRKGSFYHFFTSKSELTAAAMDEQWVRVEPSYQQLLVRDRPVLESFGVLCEEIFERQKLKEKELGHVCGCPFSSIGSEMCGTDETVRLKAAQLIERITDIMAKAILVAVSTGEIAACDPQVRSREVYSLIIGALTQARIENSLAALDGMEPAIVNLLNPLSRSVMTAVTL